MRWTLAIEFSALSTIISSLIGYDYFSSINTLIGISKNIFHWNLINSRFTFLLVIKISIKIIRIFSNLHLLFNDKCISFLYLYNKTQKKNKETREPDKRKKKVNFQVNQYFVRYCPTYLHLFHMIVHLLYHLHHHHHHPLHLLRYYLKIP